MTGIAWQYGHRGNQVIGNGPGNAASPITHSVAPPPHFKAAMPTTHCTRLPFGWLGAFAGFVVSEVGLAQQEGSDSDSLEQHDGVAAVTGVQQLAGDGSSGVVSTGSGKGECAQPHPLARHFASEPQQQTR